MAEQQLLDYIKKARGAGQTDDQSKTMLYKNGWTEAEVNEALALLDQPIQTKVEPEPEIKDNISPVVESQPEPELQTEEQPVIQPVTQPQVQPEPEPQAQFVQSDVIQKRTSSHLFLKSLIVLIIIAILGGVGYFVAGQYINLPWNPFKPSPETVISKMMANMGKVQYLNTVTSGDFSATDSNKTSLGKVSFNSEYKGNISDLKNPQADATLSINLTLPSVPSTPLANLEVKVIGSTFYFVVNDITTMAGASLSGFDISQIKGKWFKVDQDTIKALSQLDQQQLATIDASQINNSDLTKKIQSLVASADVLSFNKQLTDETVSGQNTYHYLMTVKKDKLTDLMNKIIDLQMQETAKTDASSAANSSLAQNMSKTIVSTITDAIGDTDIEMWIGKSDYMLYKTKVDKTINLSKIYPGIPDAEVSINVVNSNFDKPITIQAPADSQKLEDVVLPLMKTQKIASDLSQITTVAPSIFTASKNYYTLCQKGFLNGRNTTWGTQFVTIANDIIAMGGKNPVCFAGTKGFCISTELKDGTYMCIDEAKFGSTGTTKCTSSTTVCAPVTAQ